MRTEEIDRPRPRKQQIKTKNDEDDLKELAMPALAPLLNRHCQQTMKKDQQQHQDTTKRRRRRRCRLPDTSFTYALFAAAVTSTLSKTTTTATTEQEPSSIIATYGPHLYHTRSNLLHPPNLDYSKFTRINYSSFNVNNYGKIYSSNSNIDPLVLYGPYDWNPDASKKDITYCHKSSPELGLGQCAHHFYEEGLIGLCHMNGVQVFASVGSAGDYSVKTEEDRRMEAEVFRVVASTDGGRIEVSLQS